MARRSGAPLAKVGRWDVVALAAIVAFGLWLRVGGLTRNDPWFDDAWVLLTGRYGIHALLRMSATAPGYDLGLSLLWQSDHGATWLTQLPELAFGVCGIVALYALVTWFGCRRPIPHLAAFVVAVSPVAATYSTRLKPYAFDLLATCLVLFLAERWRRAPAPRALAWLGAASLVVVVSAASLVVVAAATVMIVVAAAGAPALRTQAAAAVAWMAVLLGGLWAASLRLLPPSLAAFWRDQGAMLQLGSIREVAFSVQQMGSGFIGGLVNTPVHYSLATATRRLADGSLEVYSLRQLRPDELVLAGCCFLLLGLVCAAPLVATARTRCRTIGPGFVASLAVLGGIAGAVMGMSPFGGGRTDEALYPAVLILVALVAESSAGRASRMLPTWLRWGVAALVCTGMVFAIAGQRPRYPSSDVRGIASVVLGRLEPDEVIVVDGDATFTWAADRLTRTGVTFNRPSPLSFWTEGFHTVSRDKQVVLAGRILEPDIRLGRLTKHAARVWLISETLGAVLGTGEANEPLNTPVASPTLDGLRTLGFTRVEARIHRLHTYAVLLGRG